jgi:hypothetical protein
MSNAVSRSSPTRPKKPRRKPGDIRAIEDAIIDVLATERPMTVRQVFYQLVGRGVIAKTEGEYKQTVVRLLTDLRRSGRVPFDWIADNTRWQRKPVTHSSLESALRRTCEAYRRSIWDNQDAYVEIWLEKDALAGVLYQVTADWDVPLMVTRGYPSLSYLHNAAEQIAAWERPAFLYYFGDYDPSGCDITRAVEEGIREFAGGAEIGFERVAVTREQIRDMGLPTRPTKTSDSRSKGFEGESVEVDAIPPGTLRDLVADCIQRHIDLDALTALENVEEMERATLGAMIKQCYG